jgi:hypothetical protein
MTRQQLIVVSNNACCCHCCPHGCCVVHKGWPLLPPVPPNLIFVAIALFITVAVRSPANLFAIAITLLPPPSLSPTTLIIVTIALAALTLALFVTC